MIQSILKQEVQRDVGLSDRSAPGVYCDAGIRTGFHASPGYTMLLNTVVPDVTCPEAAERLSGFY